VLEWTAEVADLFEPALKRETATWVFRMGWGVTIGDEWRRQTGK
jgi:hypothetical protein